MVYHYDAVGALEDDNSFVSNVQEHHESSDLADPVQSIGEDEPARGVSTDAYTDEVHMAHLRASLSHESTQYGISARSHDAAFAPMNSSVQNIKHDMEIEDSERDKCKVKHIHWQTPVTMVVGLITGLVLAGGHHFFYQHMDNKVVPGSFPPQQWVTYIGTAFAFSIKTLLAMATGMAFVQYQWKIILENSVSISHLDAMASVLKSPFAFAVFRLWIRRPFLFAIASVTWLLPLAAIITPGTIPSVQTSQTSVVNMQVPQYNWRYGGRTDISDIYGWYAYVRPGVYSGPQPAVSRAVYASGASGQVLSMPILANGFFTAGSQGLDNVTEPFLSATYHINFSGPAISCSTAPSTIVDSLAPASTLLTNLYGYDNFAGISADYFAIVPTSNSGNLTEYLVSSNAISTNMSSNTWSSSITKWPSLDEVSPDAARIYIAFPNNITTDTTQNVIECKLYNASYGVQFAFNSLPSPSQSVTFESYAMINGINAVSSNSSFATTDDGSLTSLAAKQWAYAALMDSFGSLLVGWIMSPLTGVPQVDSQHMLLTNVNTSNQQTWISSLEEVFRNMTVSLLTMPSLILNSTGAQFVPVTVVQSVQIYRYQSAELFAAYLTSVIVSLLCTIVGCWALRRNGVSFQDILSTIIRMTRSDALDNLVLVGDCGGDPLPKGWKEMEVRLGVKQASESSKPNRATQSSPPPRTLQVPSRSRSPAPRRPVFHPSPSTDSRTDLLT